jgi:hypothetical protein
MYIVQHLLFSYLHYCTQSRKKRVLSFFSSRLNWDSSTPSPAGGCASASPPLIKGEGHTRLWERRWEVPIPTRGQILLYFRYILVCTLWYYGNKLKGVECRDQSPEFELQDGGIRLGNRGLVKQDEAQRTIGWGSHSLHLRWTTGWQRGRTTQ